MNKSELLAWYKSLCTDKMPKYMEVEDANISQVCIGNKWQNRFYSWSVFQKDGAWVYVETDSDRGYVFDLKEFPTEEEVVEYAKNTLNRTYLAVKENSEQ